MTPENRPSNFFESVRQKVHSHNERPSVRYIGEIENTDILSNHVIHFAGHGTPQVSGMEEALRQVQNIDRNYDSYATALGFDLRHLTNEELKETRNAQPAITAYNINMFLAHEFFHPENLQNDPEIVSGQSLGLHSAGWFAGVYGDRNSKDAIHLAIEFARTRGEIFQQLHENPPSGHMLLAVGDKKRGTTSEDLSILESIRNETHGRANPVSLAIDVSDSRIILGGKTEDLEKFHATTKKRFENNKLRFFDVPTSCVAFHTDVMKPIEDELFKAYESIRPYMQDPKIPILTNTYQNPKLITSIDEYIEEQVRLATQPVFGRDMQKYIEERGITEGLEFGERGIIAKNMDSNMFEITPKKLAVGAVILAAGVAVPIAKEIITAYKVKKKEN